MLKVSDHEREEKVRSGTPPIKYDYVFTLSFRHSAREVSEGEWESMPSASSADAKWDHQIHKVRFRYTIALPCHIYS